MQEISLVLDITSLVMILLHRRAPFTPCHQSEGKKAWLMKINKGQVPAPTILLS